MYIEFDDLINLPNLDDVIYYHCMYGHIWSNQFKTGDYETLHVNADRYHHDEDAFAVINKVIQEHIMYQMFKLIMVMFM